MSEPNQGVTDAPTIDLNPDIEYADPALQEMQKQQFPSSDDVQREDNQPDPNDSVDTVQDGEKTKEVKDPKVPEPQKKEEPKQEPSQEELVAELIKSVKSELPEPLSPYVDEYYANEGKLSKETLDKIKEEHGYDASMVDTFIKTFADNYELKNKAQAAEEQAKAVETKAEADKFISELVEQVGGEDEWKDMVEWAATEAPEEVVNDYNEYVEHPDPKVVRLAVKNLHAAYTSSKPKSPEYIKATENISPGPAIKPFASEHEMKAAYMDARYGADPGYTAEVEKRTASTLQRIS